jgi:vacuolar-type H+-ATPase subunit F/Vma7
MTYRIRIVGRQGHVAGFAGAGLPTSIVAPDSTGLGVIQDLVETPDIGVVLVTQDVYDAVAPALERWLSRKPLPMVVPIPNPQWRDRAGSAESHIVELLRRAIGYRVRVR